MNPETPVTPPRTNPSTGANGPWPWARRLLAPLVLGLVAACGGPEEIRSDLTTVNELDLKRYEGRWYDVADFPQRFQMDCVCTRANYSINPLGEVTVFNSCRTGSPEGRQQSIVGRARLPDPDQPGRLKVSFFPPFESDYWVIERGADYEYAVVSDPEKSTLWVLSRTPTMEPAVMAGIRQRLEQQGFDLSRLTEVSQAGCPDDDVPVTPWFPQPWR